MFTNPLMKKKYNQILLAWLNLFEKRYFDAFCMILLYCLLVGVKLLYVRNAGGPMVFFDEYLYKTLSRSITSGIGYTVNGSFFTIYPPLYPLILAPSFLSINNWYFWMLAINVFTSSLLIFPVWWTARIFLERQDSWYCVIASSIISFHAVSVRLIMSENLFVPLFILSVYMLLKNNKNDLLINSFVTGVVWGMCYLTKHIFLTTLPVFFVLWWLKPFFVGKKGWVGVFNSQHFSQLLMVVGGFVFAYSPWLIYAVVHKANILNAMGLSLVGGQSQQPIAVIAQWTFIYICYLLLVSAPYLPFLFALPWTISKVKPGYGNFLILSFVALIGSFTIVASYYVARVFGVQWINIDGRYLTTMVPLLPIVVFLIVKNLSELNLVIRRKLVIWSAIGAASMIWMAYLVLFEGKAWELSPYFASIPNAAPDIMIFASGKTGFVDGVILLFLCGLVWLGSILTIAGRIKPNNLFYLVCLVIFQVGNIRVIQKTLVIGQEYSRHGVALSDVIKDSHTNINVVIDDTLSINSLALALMFWEVPERSYAIYKYSHAEDVEMIYPYIESTVQKQLHVVLSSSELPKDGVFITTKKYHNPLAQYEVNEADYFVYRYPMSSDENLEILDFGPKESIVNEAFNIQPDGEAAMWIIAKNVTPQTIIVFGEDEIACCFTTTDSLTVKIPSYLYSQPGTLDIYLYDYITRQKSNLVQFIIKGQ